MMDPDQMHRLDKASGEQWDQMSLTMIEHHEGAIEMARTEQANGENPDAVALAKKIEKDRKAERQDAGHAQSLPSGSSAGPHRDHLSRQADGVTAPGAGPPVNVLAWPGDTSSGGRGTGPAEALRTVTLDGVELEDIAVTALLRASTVW